MKLNLTKRWLAWAAETENEHDVSVGTPQNLIELHAPRLAELGRKMEEARKQTREEVRKQMLDVPAATAEQELAEYTALTRTSVSDWILDTFGERCDEFEETCIVCQKWKLFDQLFEGLE